MFISAHMGVTVLLPDLEAACEPKSSQVHTHSICSINVCSIRGNPDICTRVVRGKTIFLLFWVIFLKSPVFPCYPDPAKTRLVQMKIDDLSFFSQK